MSTQLIGFSIGGINRKFLVDPPSMSMLSIMFMLLFLLLKYPALYLQSGQQTWSTVPSSTPFILNNMSELVDGAEYLENDFLLMF